MAVIIIQTAQFSQIFTMCSHACAQLDDWWYYWDKNGAVKNWTAMPNIFPNGIPPLVNKTGWRVFAHNKWW